MACSLFEHHEKIQHGQNACSHHQIVVQKCQQYSTCQRPHWRMVPNHRLSGMLPISNTLQHLLGENNDASVVEPHRNCHIGGRNITSLCFVDDINGLAGEEQKLKELVECLDKTYSNYGMEISADKTKLVTNCP